MRTRPLQVVLAAIGLYAVAMVVAGGTVGRLFDALGFGAETAGVPAGAPTDHVLLLQGVLGAVILGWVVLIAAVVRLGARSGLEGWWGAVSLSLVVWFVADTGFSLAVGSWQHALFNAAFAVVLVPALLHARPRAVS